MKPIKGYEDYLINEDGTKIYSVRSKRYLTIQYNVCKLKNRDYIKPFVILTLDGKHKTKIVSNLVYATYNGDLKPGYQVDHIDNNPQNNHYSNLQLLTASANNKKRFTDTPEFTAWGNKTRKVKCITTNEVFYSLRECARKLKLSVGALHRSVKWIAKAYT